MVEIKWDRVFDEVHVNDGASDDEISILTSTVSIPLSREERDYIHQEQDNPFPKQDPLYSTWQPIDPSAWHIPASPFPEVYLNLLKWSNGAECRTGERWFQFFPANDPTHGVRAMLLAYYIPEYMPSAIPFAFNGSGTFYMFDMRKKAHNGEYPIICARSGSLGFEESLEISDSLLGACQGKQDVDRLIFEDF